MNEIAELENKINYTISKVKLALSGKKASKDVKQHQVSTEMVKIQELEEENKKLREEFSILLKQHETDLKTVDTLIEQLNVILEDKNG